MYLRSFIAVHVVLAPISIDATHRKITQQAKAIEGQTNAGITVSLLCGVTRNSVDVVFKSGGNNGPTAMGIGADMLGAALGAVLGIVHPILGIVYAGAIEGVFSAATQ